MKCRQREGPGGLDRLGDAILAAMSEPEIRYTRASDGMRVAYQFIEGRDPVLIDSPVFGHQFALVEGIASWREYREVFRGDQAWALLDYRGSGLSGRVEGSVSIDDFALDFEAVAAELAGRELVVTATASGIAPAVEYVIQHPDQVRGMLLRSPGKAAFPPMLLGLLRENLEEGLFIVARTMYDWESEVEIRPMVRDWVRGLQERVLWESADAFAAWDIAARLQSLSVPLAMWGDAPNEEEVAELAADLEGAQVVISGSGPIIGERMATQHRALIAPWLAEPAGLAVRPRQTAVQLDQLTPRQLDVLRLVADGHTNKAIADRLSIAPGTVARHVSDILDTTGLANRTEAARHAAEQGLLR